MGGVFSKFGAAFVKRPPERDGDGKRLCVAQGAFENYDVFISHRGPDTKTGFVDFLDKDLRKAGLHPFLDQKSIPEGQDSWKCIECAIQRTPLALVIFSENFTQSEWCLRELHTMLACPSVKVLPIFYNVQPSDVYSLQNGQLAVGFTELAKRFNKTLIEEWRVDLKKASTIKGWERRVGAERLEVDLVQDVVGKILELANKPLPLHVGDHIVGVKQVVENLIQIVDEKKVLILGLWGMGGIGKSTLARELYNQLGRRYDASCYVEDVTEKVKKGDVTIVQNLILKELCGMSTIVNKSSGKVILEERLSKKPILVVLDDVCDGDTNHEVHTHDVQLLNQDNSRTVFACHVFGGDGEVPQEFGVLVRDVSMACRGVPLVLEVCGCLLTGEKDVRAWNEVLGKLRGCTIINDTRIFECLRISYDALPKEHQEIFLDITCALLGESVKKAQLVWRHGVLGVRSLVEKALIRVDEFGILCMHDYLRDMGRAIARDGNLRICKRIWDSECLELLNANEPLPDFVESLILWRGKRTQGDLSLRERLRILKCECGGFMMSSFPKNLRWLQNFGSSEDMPESPENNELVILIWRWGIFEKLPESFGNLRKLELLILDGCHNLVQLPNSFGCLQKLAHLDLHGSGIRSLPESFGTLSDLEVLHLEGCRQLVKLPNSFGGLQKLTHLYLHGSGIRSLPESFGTLSNLNVVNLKDCVQLVKLPNSFGGLQKLTHLDFQGCSQLAQLPTSFGGLQKLTHLYLYGNGIRSLPESFGTLSDLEVLHLEGCCQLVQLPNSFGGLQKLTHLYLHGSGIRSLPELFGNLSNLNVVNLKNCDQLVELPNSFGGLQ